MEISKSSAFLLSFYCISKNLKLFCFFKFFVNASYDIREVNAKIDEAECNDKD